MILGIADSILGARRVCDVRARIDAAFFNASPIIGTVGIRVTFDALATVEWVSGVTRWTLASRFVVAAVAFGVSCTRISQDTRIDTLAVVALFVVAAFIVRLATH